MINDTNKIEKIEKVILSALVVDSYNLGTHWIYDENQLKNHNINWQELNSPISQWHKNKTKGDFTHYGDQIVLLYEYIKNNNTFDSKEYIKIWLNYMKTYQGYIDGSSRQTIQNYENSINEGSNSTDLSIIGRISPLLLISANEKEFLQYVEDFVTLTHNSLLVIESSRFFAKLLYRVFEGNDILKTINDLYENEPENIQNYINKGLNSTKNSTEAIKEFGLACDINDGFSSVIYILKNYSYNFKDAIINNAKALGDNSARAILIAIIIQASSSKNLLEKNWLHNINYKIN
jgi:ADP-ribosylglycohydrolase